MADSAVVHKRRFGSRWLIIGAIALLFVLVIAAVLTGAAGASGAIQDADKTVKTTIDHQKTVGSTLATDPFKDIDFKSRTRTWRRRNRRWRPTSPRSPERGRWSRPTGRACLRSSRVWRARSSRFRSERPSTSGAIGSRPR